MRTARITGKDRFERPVFHCMSRGYDGNFVLGSPDEKEHFRRLLDRVVGFTGVELLTHCVMGNHFHLVVRIPPPPDGGIPDAELLRRMGRLYSRTKVANLRHDLREAREAGQEAIAEHLRRPFLRRMHSLSFFMKELKQRYSLWYNKRAGRRGTLWEDRFKSVLVEDGEALRTVCKYVDLNPVRAGLVEDPKDYRWCGYAEAVAGSAAAREGLRSAHAHPLTGEAPEWAELQGIYRVGLFGTGEVVERGGRVKRRGIDPAKVRETWERGGRLSWTEVVRCRTRYLTDSAVFGSRGFVERAAEAHRELFGRIRPREKAHPVPAEGLLGMCSLRDLRERPLG